MPDKYIFFRITLTRITLARKFLHLLKAAAVIVFFTCSNKAKSQNIWQKYTFAYAGDSVFKTLSMPYSELSIGGTSSGNRVWATPGNAGGANNLYTNSGNGFDIGFNFKFNCADFSKVGISRDGYIWFWTDAATAPSGPNWQYQAPITGSPFAPEPDVPGIISAFDGATSISYYTRPYNQNSNSSIRCKTTGSAPNRIFTVEWKDVMRISNNADFSNGVNLVNHRYSVQLSLHEDGRIRIVLNTVGFHSGLSPASVAGQVGIRAGSNDYFFRKTGGGSGLNWCHSSSSGTFNTCSANGSITQ
jgi:hypothetical protein